MIKRTVFLSLIALMLLSEKTGFTQESDPGLRSKIRVHLNALDSRNWERAVEELVNIGEPAVNPLIDLLNQNTGYPSARASHALAGIGTPEAVQALKAVFRNKRFNYQVKNYALAALEKVPSEEVIHLMIEVLQQDDQWGIRMRAADTLGKIGSPLAAKALKAACHDENDYVRGSALQALAKVDPERAGDILVDALSDESWETWSKAYQSLVDMGEPAVDHLIEALKEKSIRVRKVAARALGRIKTDRAVEPLIEMLKDEDWMVRNDAAVALVRINSQKVLEPLTQLLKNPNTHIAEEAAWILGEMKSRKAMQTYRHPTLNIQFQAPARWRQIPWSEDPAVYEMTGPEKNVHVRLWLTETQQDGPGYLKKMADMKDLTWQGEPIFYPIDGRKAWLLHTNTQRNEKSVRQLLAVIHHEKSRKHADHNTLFIVEIRCPRAHYPQQKQLMQNILHSVRFTE
jgi:HEAT repeat protein